MTMHIATATRNTMLDAITTALGSAAYIELRSGTQPANANTAPTDGAVLAVIPLDNPAGAGSSGGVLTITTDANTQDSSADASGTATWARVYASGGTAVFDGSVAASGADFTIGSTSVVAGQIVKLTGATITLPA